MATGSLFDKFCTGLGQFGDFMSKHSDKILPTVQWVLNHAPEIGLAAFALSGVIVDPLILYAGYTVAGGLRDMFNKATGYDPNFDSVRYLWQGYTQKLSDDEAREIREKYNSSRHGLRLRSKSGLDGYLKNIGMERPA